MAAVQQRILNWLYSVLTSEYHDVNRTYNDVAQSLSHYSALTPRTDVYTSEDGASALLLQLSGTLPVLFRGTTYRFPVTLWIPHAYPRQAPMVYVVPTEGMAVRAGQHVDPQGKVYHPYLVAWAENAHRSNVLDFLTLLRDVFAKEPPVVARPQPRLVSIPISPRIQQDGPAPPPRPPRPGDVQSQTPTANTDTSIPPPPPPKLQGQSASPQAPQDQQRTSVQQPPQARDYGQAPPLPQYPPSPQYQPQRQSSLRQETPPRSLVQGQRPTSLYGQNHFRDVHGVPGNALSQTTQGHHPVPQQYGPPGQAYQRNQQPQNHHHNNMPQVQQHLKPGTMQVSKPMAPDLMNEPIGKEVSSSVASNLPAPPVPNNPEIEMLLGQIAAALHAERQKSLSQTKTSLPGLAVQNAAMIQSMQAMQNEITQLNQLSQVLTSNTQILHSALKSADATIAAAATREPPNIDDILVAPTVVGNQLYREVCEERAIADTIFVLGRAVERGRIPAQIFVKTTRALAREWFEKKRLVRKIGRGMGLDMSASGHAR